MLRYIAVFESSIAVIIIGYYNSCGYIWEQEQKFEPQEDERNGIWNEYHIQKEKMQKY